MGYYVKFDLCTYILQDKGCISTIYENISEAKEKGLEGIGIVARGSVHTGDKSLEPVKEILNLPSEIKGIKILKGVEGSLLSLGRTETDIDINLIDKGDFSLVSYYKESFPNFIPDGSKITGTLKTCLLSDKINGVGQFTFLESNVNLRDLIAHCKAHKKFIEFSNDKIKTGRISEADAYKIAALCKDFEVPIIVTSGARLFSDVGDFSEVFKILEKVDFPQKLILNEKKSKFMDYIHNT